MDQYARKGGRSIDVAVQKVLLFDVIRMRRISGTGFASDLMSNYDRMVHGASGLALRRMGAPPSAVKCMSSTVMNMKHFIRTAYGDSDSFYGGNPELPLQGGGQGSPAAPPMWIAMTVVLLHIASSHEAGVQLVSAISNILVAFSAIMYVDDTDLFTIAKPNESDTQLCLRTQMLADKWIDGLYATGAVLRPEKCWWLFIAFAWEGSKWRYQEPDESDFQLLVPDVKGDLQVVKRIRHDTQKRTLGVRMSGNGSMISASNDNNEKGEYDYLKGASIQWASSITNSYLNRGLSSLALKSTISKTWTYPLAATKLTKKQCDQIMLPVYNAVLPKMGFNRKLPRAYRFAPLSHQGQDLPHLFLIQGTEQIKMFLTHLGKGTHVCDVIVCCLESASIEVGVGGNILAQDFCKFGHLLTDSWVKTLSMFCHNNDIVLEGEYPWPAPFREHDDYLMKMLIDRNQGLFSLGEIRLINRCRLYLQLMSLSDACTGEGNRFTHSSIIGTIDKDRRSKWIWPVQARPTPREWSVWRRCVRQIWAPRPGHSIDKCLGLWLHDGHQNWHWFTDETSIYYRVHMRCWKEYKNDPSQITTRAARFYHDGTMLCRPPPLLARCSVKIIDDSTIIHEGYCGRVIQQTSECVSENTIESAILRSHPMLQQMLRDSRWIDDGHSMAMAIAAGSGRCVVDGSFHPDYKIGTAAFVFDDGDDAVQASGCSRAFGDPNEMSSYRAELFGIYMALNTTHLLCQQFQITSGAIEFGCDNITAIQKGLAELFYPNIQHRNFDLLWAIHHLRHLIPVEITFRHVRGHQDEIDNAVLDPWALLNIMVDKEAKWYLSKVISDPSRDADLKIVSPHWNVYMDGPPITCKVSQTIIEKITSKNMKQFLVRTKKLTSYTYDLVDWDSSGRAIRQMSPPDMSWVTKFASGFCGTAHMMARWKNGGWETNKCPRCGSCVENTEHLLWCSHARARLCRHEATTAFLSWMTDNHTEPSLYYCVAQVLQRGHHTSFTAHTSKCINPSVKELGKEQDEICMMNFFRGRISKKWISVQDSYLRRNHIPTRKRGSTWAAGFIKQIYKWCRTLWDDRNALVHSKIADDKARAVASDTDCKIIKEFQKGINGIRARDQHIILDVSVDEVLSKHQFDKLNWLRHVKAARLRCQNFELTQMERMRKFMEKWKRRRK